MLLTLGYSDTLHVSEWLVRQVAGKELRHRKDGTMKKEDCDGLK